MADAVLPSPAGQVAITYARRGWKVFPCREKPETIVVRGKDGPKEVLRHPKAPYTGNGLKDATTDEQVILGWWRRWPGALVGLPMGENGLFALDFDPRTDPETGEVFDLVRLKAETEAQIGCALPVTLAAMTQSGGVHAIYRQPHDGEPIRNRGNLPRHVDVRGVGGYIVAAGSVMAAEAGGGRYRWLAGRQDSEPAEAPAALIAVLRARKRATNDVGASAPAASPFLSARAATGAATLPDEVAPTGSEEHAAVRKYALAAMDEECRELAKTPIGGGRWGGRNNGIYHAALKLGGLTVFNKMKAMIALEPRLARGVQTHKRSIYLKTCAALFELLTGAEEGKHGKSPTVIVGDEMHEWRSRTVEQTLRQGTGARLQPIELYASTAGLRTNVTGVELWDESLAIMEGRTADPSSLVVIFAANDNAAWDDERTWAKANPSLGLSPTVAFLRREAAIAKDNPRAEAYFRCYHLNQWVDAVVRWLNVKRWDACAEDATAWRSYPERLKGRPCFGAIDVSSTQDVTALVWVFPPHGDDPKWRIVCRFWVPEATLAERVKNDRVKYDRWVAAGAMETTPGDYVDQNFVKRAVLDGMDAFDVRAVAYDPWNAQKLAADLQADGVDPEQLLVMRQGIQSLGEPTKHFERLVYAGRLDHGGHPVLRWMAGNAVVRFDENLNFMVAKKRSAEKVDGIAAGVMAVGAALMTNDDGSSVYDTRGILELDVDAWAD